MLICYFVPFNHHCPFQEPRISSRKNFWEVDYLTLLLSSSVNVSALHVRQRQCENNQLIEDSSFVSISGRRHMGETFSSGRKNNRQAIAIRVSHLAIPYSPWL